MSRAREIADRDLAATELILDADNDTSITADTDDQIDIKVGNVDKVIITGNGDVSIGGNTPNTYSGYTALTIGGSASTTGSTIDFEDSDGNRDAQVYADANYLYLSNTDVKVETGNLVIGTSGKGIDFSAASNDSEMTSELLDDYEEGLATMAFSPGAGSITINSSYEKLSYTKIGRMVQINGQVASSAVSGIGTGNTLQITGLPFAAADLDDAAGRCGFHVAHDSAVMVDGREIFGFVNEGGAVINIYEQNSAGASNKAEIMDSNASLYFSFTYNTT